MTTAYSTNLGLALPVQGELSGTWGDTVNNGITQYSDIAIAGTLTLNGDGAVTLTNTNGDASGTNIGSTTAQYAILKITGTLTTTKVITAPSSSKTYTVINAAAGGSVTIKASGQTGVSIAVGEQATVVFNGTDYVKSGSSNATLAGTSGGVLYFSTASTWASSAVLTANAIMVGGGTGSAPSTITTGTGVTTALGNIANTASGFVTGTGAATFQNKRIDPRVSSTTSAASITPDISSFDQYCLTAQAAGLTINAPSGTPVDGDKLIIRILDNGTSQTLTWNATFVSMGVTIPTATTINKTTYVGCIYNANNTRWDVVAATTQG